VADEPVPSQSFGANVPASTIELGTMGKLTASQIDEYFAEHLPYRTGIMLAHYRMARTPWTGDVAQLNACFIAALVTGRLFLNVVGIGKMRVGDDVVLGRFSPQDADVMVDDLGGVPIDPAALPLADRDLFLNFLNMADKAAATSPRP
jgi:hypothetical protein